MTTLLAADNPITHVVQQWYWRPYGITVLSNHTVMQLLGAALLAWVLPRAVRMRAGEDEIGRLVPRGLGNAIEGVCVLLRRHVAEPTLGRHTDEFIGFIWTVFFFILTMNLLGMVPLNVLTQGLDFTHGHGLGGTATGNIWVTGTFAGLALLMILISGFRANGLEYVRHFFMGPWYLAWLIGLLEIVGVFFKAFALAVRLFANMIAGHILLAVLIGFAAMAYTALGLLGGTAVTLLVIVAGVLVNLLELFVAFLQAFIFTFLATMFIGQAIHIHRENHAHEREHEPERTVEQVIESTETEGPLVHTHA